MIISSKNGVALRLSSNGTTLSFQDLRRLVSEKAAKLSSPLEILTASPSFEFVISVLAALEARVPVAVVSSLSSFSGLDPRAQLLLVTSGSSDQPKVVQLSLSNIEAGVAAVSKSLNFSLAEKQYLTLPLHYSFGLLGQLLPALSCGTETVLVDSTMGLAGLARESGLRGMISGVPSQLNVLCQLIDEQPDVTHVVSAGAFLPVELRQTLRRRFPRAELFTNYGQTEAAPRILCLSSRDPAFFTDASGYAVGHWKLKLSAEGELLVSGPQVMLGYLSGPPIRDGWLHTGDLASIAADGLVTIRGRNDDLLKINGERVSPQEVEAVLSSWPEVAEAYVFGLEDTALGTQLAAVVMARSTLTESEWRSKLAGSLRLGQRPVELYLASSLPKNERGKIERKKLSARKGEWQRIF